MVLEQLQQGNPLAEAEQVKAQASLQAKIIDLQSKRELDAAKLSEQKRQFNIKTTQDANQNRQKVAFDLTKLEVDSGEDIPGSVV